MGHFTQQHYKKFVYMLVAIYVVVNVFPVMYCDWFAIFI